MATHPPFLLVMGHGIDRGALLVSLCPGCCQHRLHKAHVCHTGCNHGPSLRGVWAPSRAGYVHSACLSVTFHASCDDSAMAHRA